MGTARTASKTGEARVGASGAGNANTGGLIAWGSAATAGSVAGASSWSGGASEIGAATGAQTGMAPGAGPFHGEGATGSGVTSSVVVSDASIG